MTAFLSRLPLAARLSAGSALLCAPSVVNWMLAADEGRRLAAVAANGKSEAVIAALRTAGEANLYFSGVAVAGSMVLAAAMTWVVVKAERGLTRTLERLSSDEGSALAIPPGVCGGRAKRALEACFTALATSRARAEQGAAAAEAQRQLREDARLEMEAERRTVMAALAAGLAALAAARRGVELGIDPQLASPMPPLAKGPTEGSEKLSAAAGSRAPRGSPSTRAPGRAIAAPEVARVWTQSDARDESSAAEVDDLRALLMRLGGKRGGVQIGATVARAPAWMV